MTTLIDTQKENTNRLVSICGKYRTIRAVNGETITLVGLRQWNKWTKNNDYVTDF